MTAALAFPLPALPSAAPEASLTVSSSPTSESGGAAAGLAALRTQVASVVAGGRTAGAPWATGIGPLDAALGGGIPRGRITEVVGARGVGKTALLRQVVSRVLGTGGWVAWIDAGRTLAAAPWAGLGERLVMIRPRRGQRSAWCADLLLRSGVFALVVIDGAPALSRVHGVRLAQLARERDAACVVLQDTSATSTAHGASRVSGAVRVRVDAVQRSRAAISHTTAYATSHATSHELNATSPTTSPTASRGFSVVVEKGGSSHRNRSIEVNSDIVMARRVCTDSQIPDRRGVARGTRRPWAAQGGSSDDAVGHPITWGGLGVGDAPRVDSIYGTPNGTGPTSGTPTHRDATGAGVVRTDHATRYAERYAARHDAPPTRERERDRERIHERDRERFTREFGGTTRDWTKYRGRRRAAESSFGRPSRRERARERVGAAIGQHGGQGGPRHSAPRLGRDTR